MYTFAHRGGRAHGGDNLLATFTAAVARGARGLETDAWLTADGVVVLDHDGVHRAARRRHLPLAEVRRDQLPAHIPTLDELYDAVGVDLDLAIDVRLPAVGEAVIDVARRHGALQRLWLVAENADHLPAWRRLDGDVHLAVTLPLVDRRRSMVAAAAAAGAQALNMRWPWWSMRWVERTKSAGLLAFGYDAQSPLALRRCTHLGLDGVFSDHVDRLHNATAG